ncbi:MAG TPA: cytochrome P450, partial [Chitinophagaceae bacterium]|nr:cytochrome P450 [Chitinophagaceae bacterium]
MAEQPVYRDGQSGVWAVYSYALCRRLLAADAGRIPPVATQGLNEYALAITGRLARLGNDPGHAVARQAAHLLFQGMRPVGTRDILTGLLPQQQGGVEIDWVESVGRKLPVLHLLAGFGINREEGLFIAGHMDMLLKLMAPVKTVEQVAAVNALAQDIYVLLERHIRNTAVLMEVVRAITAAGGVPADEALALCISNLAGLLIQSYDACRGILGNALLHFLRGPGLAPPKDRGMDYWLQAVTEIFRFDPPVHHTRRVASEDIVAGDDVIKKGQTILLVLAAANRDAGQFAHPDRYDPARPNNNTHLGFGFGAHMCVAKAFSTQLAAEALQYLFEHYSSVRL